MTPIDAPGAEIAPPVQPRQSAPIQSVKTVRVELVWPAERGPKIDCRGNTKIVWTGPGDVQDYPADQWYLLAAHPDVWKLVDDADAQVAERAKQEVVETPEGRLERLHLEQSRAKAVADSAQAAKDAHARHEALRLDAQRRKDDGAQTNTDVVVGEKDPPDPLSAEQMADRQAAYKLVTQGTAALDAAYQAKAEADEAGLAMAEHQTALRAGLGQERTAQNEQGPVDVGVREPVVTDPKEPPLPAVPQLTEKQLAAMSNAEVHAEGDKRGYELHPRLNAANLRERFLEYQAEAQAQRRQDRRDAKAGG